MGFITGLLSGGKAKTTTPAAVSGLQLQSSTQGLPVQIAFGATLVAPNLIWYGDFVATQQASSAGAGGKGGGGGGGGGKGGGSSGSYVYQTAVAMGLCEGPIAGIGSVYANKQVTDLGSLGLTLLTGSYTQAPWGYLSSNHPDEALTPDRLFGQIPSSARPSAGPFFVCAKPRSRASSGHGRPVPAPQAPPPALAQGRRAPRARGRPQGYRTMLVKARSAPGP